MIDPHDLFPIPPDDSKPDASGAHAESGASPLANRLLELRQQMQFVAEIVCASIDEMQVVFDLARTSAQQAEPPTSHDQVSLMKSARGLYHQPGQDHVTQLCVAHQQSLRSINEHAAQLLTGIVQDATAEPELAALFQASPLSETDVLTAAILRRSDR